MNGFLGVVEDTNNGHWRYNNNQATLGFPVVSIARSPIKGIEDRLIGDAVVFSLEALLRSQLYETLDGKKVLILGYGKIGSACARALKSRRSTVLVYDVDPLKMMEARVDGMEIGVREQLVQRADLIVGATGRQSLTVADRCLFKNGVVLASASSRNLEFDVDEICRGYLGQETAKQLVSYSGPAGATFFLCNGGFPVNFIHSSALGPVLDAIYSELFLCLLEIEESRAPKGLSDSTNLIHARVANVWCNVHGLVGGERRC
jgi:adenosylhomocysteinase